MGRFVRCAARVLPAALIVASMMSPAPSAAQDMPSYARPAAAATAPAETITGRIVAVNGAYRISLADDRGFTDDVALQQGTIINPTGLTLTVGMTVTIRGYNAGNTFAATEIDTGYAYTGAAPQSVYYGPDWWYPGYAFGYGPAFSLGFAAIGSPFLIEQPFFFFHHFHHHFHGQPFFVQPVVGTHPVRRLLGNPPATGHVNPPAPVSPPAAGFATRSVPGPATRAVAPVSRSAGTTHAARSGTTTSRR